LRHGAGLSCAFAVAHVLLLATVWQFIAAAFWHLALMLLRRRQPWLRDDLSREQLRLHVSVIIPGIFLSCVPYLGRIRDDDSGGSR
jgi:hypothetical protein